MSWLIVLHTVFCLLEFLSRSNLTLLNQQLLFCTQSLWIRPFLPEKQKSKCLCLLVLFLHPQSSQKKICCALRGTITQIMKTVGENRVLKCPLADTNTQTSTHRGIRPRCNHFYLFDHKLAGKGTSISTSSVSLLPRDFLDISSISSAISSRRTIPLIECFRHLVKLIALSDTMHYVLHMNARVLLSAMFAK